MVPREAFYCDIFSWIAYKFRKMLSIYDDLITLGKSSIKTKCLAVTIFKKLTLVAIGGLFKEKNSKNDLVIICYVAIFLLMNQTILYLEWVF